MTPAQEAGIVKGKRYRVVDEGDEAAFEVGAIVELYEDDDTLEPLFSLVSGHCEFENAGGFMGAYLYVGHVEEEEENQ